MSEGKKELILRLPEKIFEIIKKYKEATGVSYTNFIYNSIFWYCISKGLISLEYLNSEMKKK